MIKAISNIDDGEAPNLHDIIIAAENSDFQGVDKAIEENSLSIVFKERVTGMTALHVASGNGNLLMVKHLLSKPGVDPKIFDNFGRDPLDLAICIGHKETIETLSRFLYPKSFGQGGSGGPDLKLVP